MKKLLLLIAAFMFAHFYVPTVFGVDAGVPAEAPADFLSQVFDTIAKLGGMPTMVKISAIIMLVVASMKVSVLKRYVWDRLGPLQVWLAPVLGLIAGILGLGANGAPITLALVLTYVTAGTGAVFLHEILDSLKALPGIGPVYLAIIEVVERLLGGRRETPARSVVKG